MKTEVAELVTQCGRDGSRRLVGSVISFFISKAMLSFMSLQFGSVMCHCKYNRTNTSLEQSGTKAPNSSILFNLLVCL